MARVKRAAIGIMLCLGPFNYPFNETYATMIPALLMGNIVILKLPAIGGLVHVLTMEAFAESLPPGVINFISGSGRTTIPPVRIISLYVFLLLTFLYSRMSDNENRTNRRFSLHRRK
jgi:acyl-CoA reductase-like NAD-dependent aldehyde dehydrogenase